MSQFVRTRSGAAYRLKVALEKHWEKEQHGPRAVQTHALHRARLVQTGEAPDPGNVYRLRVIK